MKTSAGILAYRIHNTILEVLLVHPGGPFFRNKDFGFWSVPKGEIRENEDMLETAKREFAEELGVVVPEGELIPLHEVKQKGGKVVYAWALNADIDESSIILGATFELEWPPKSGNIQVFPETDQAQYFPADIAKQKINTAQAAFIEQLEKHLNLSPAQTVIQPSLL